MKIITKMMLAATAAVSGLSGATNANAGVLVNRAALNAVLGANQTFEDFEKFTNTSQLMDYTVLHSTADWADQGPGKVAAGVNYFANNEFMFLNADGYYGLKSRTLGDSSSNRAITLTYTQPVTAFGFDLQSFAGYGTNGRISVYDRDGVRLTVAAVTGGVNGASNWFGFENAAGIGSVLIEANFLHSLMIDNHGYGAAVAAVPEPATWAMMMAGFGMIGAGIRSRRRIKTVTFA